MSRPALRRSFRVESLESRQLLTAGGPSREAQYMLAELNLARTNPSAAAQQFTNNLGPDAQATVGYFNINLDSVRSQLAAQPTRPPLAWNDQLAAAATWQSQDQANTGVQSHTGSDGSTNQQRLDRVGYTNRTSSGENAYAYSESVDHAMEAFLIDWGVSSNGHRNNIFQPDATPSQVYREVGIGIVATNKSNIGPYVMTQDFGTQANSLPELLGVAYNDPGHTGRYALGSGVGNVQVNATNNATGETKSVLTWDAGGGYQIALAPGDYTVTAKVGDNVVSSKQVAIGHDNVQLDYNLTDLKPIQPVSAPAPVVAAPAPTPAQAAPKPAPVVAAQVISVAPVSAPDRTAPAPAPVVAAPAATKFSWMATWSSWTARKA